MFEIVTTSIVKLKKLKQILVCLNKSINLETYRLAIIWLCSKLCKFSVLQERKS